MEIQFPSHVQFSVPFVYASILCLFQKLRRISLMPFYLAEFIFATLFTYLCTKYFDMEFLRQFPYFSGKKVLYVHGFGSSGQSNTPCLLQQMMPEAQVLAPDLPIHPQQALDILKNLVAEEQPSVIIGTSMGGMYAEMLRGVDRVLVNPAFNLHETLRTNVGLGKVTFFNPRRDGVQEFMLTKGLLEEYKEITLQNFHGADDEEEQQHVFGLFGTRDEMVHTEPLFREHYRHAIPFDGEHRLNDHVLLHSLMPLLGRIDQRQSGHERPVVYVHSSAWHPEGEALHAAELLAQRYDVYLVSPPSQSAPSQAVAFWRRTVTTDSLSLLLGDYLLTAPFPDSDADEFIGTRLQLGSPDFKTWEDVLRYFELLGGQ